MKMQNFVPCAPGTTLLYFMDGQLTSEPGVAWVFDSEQEAEDGYYVPNLIGAWGSQRLTQPGAAVMLDGKVYTSDSVYDSLEQWRAHMDDQPQPQPQPQAKKQPQPKLVSVTTKPSLWDTKDGPALSPSLAVLV